MNKLITRHNKKLLLIVLLGTLVLAGGLLFSIKSNKKTSQPSVAINQVSDESLGLSFSISKDFDRIPSQELISQNPSFVYGFRPKGITDVSCIVSQTQRLKPGSVPIEQLAQGTYEQIKKTKPDAQVLVSEKTHLADGRDAARLEVSYSEGKSKVKQLEVVATTDQRTTFAFCFSPDPVASLYRDAFLSFLTSLKIN